MTYQDMNNYRKQEPLPKVRRPSIAVVDRSGYTEEVASLRIVSVLIFGIGIALMLGGCATERGLPIFYMPDPPKECSQISEFKVEPFPKGKTTDAQVSVWLAKEGAARQKEHEISKVCADYALGSASVMADKEKPGDEKKKKLAQKAAQPTKDRKNAAQSTPTVEGGIPTMGGG